MPAAILIHITPLRHVKRRIGLPFDLPAFWTLLKKLTPDLWYEKKMYNRFNQVGMENSVNYFLTAVNSQANKAQIDISNDLLLIWLLVFVAGRGMA